MKINRIWPILDINWHFGIILCLAHRLMRIERRHCHLHFNNRLTGCGSRKLTWGDFIWRSIMCVIWDRGRVPSPQVIPPGWIIGRRKRDWMRVYVIVMAVTEQQQMEHTFRLLMAGTNGILFLYAIHAIWIVELVSGLMVHLSQWIPFIQSSGSKTGIHVSCIIKTGSVLLRDAGLNLIVGSYGGLQQRAP